MTIQSSDRSQNFDFSSVDLLEPLLQMDTGVIIVDTSGRIVFYNKAQARTDQLKPSMVLDRRITDVYDLSENQSLILLCIRNAQPIIQQKSSYRVCGSQDFYQGIYSVFPLRSEGRMSGAICFAQSEELLSHAVSSPVPEKQGQSSLTLTNNTQFAFSDLIGASPEFLACITRAKAAAGTKSAVMICGETGTGKEILAQAIHDYSSRRNYPFIAVNCAAIPETLQESTLFGTTRGAFTGAMAKKGLFEEAEGGTLYLDEVDSMPLSLQAKLLRTLQDMKMRRVGSNREMSINLRIISSFKKDYLQPLPKDILRKDLYYRLSVVYLEMPPLRMRKNDLDLLVKHFIHCNNLSLGLHVEGVSPSVMELFTNYNWPGNVRELEHVLEGAMNACGNETILQLDHLPTNFAIGGSSQSGSQSGNDLYTFFPISDQDKFLQGLGRIKSDHDTVEFQEKINLTKAQNRREAEVLYRVIKATQGNISEAARQLGISRQLLHYKLKKFGIAPKEFKK
ncbi:MAG: sigma 54-interacting transcriptional regulator [Desulfovermiculus sp.]|nr:sigma 54-interacting transcriptional regulator [Desulfovermiculus sp.]